MGRGIYYIFSCVIAIIVIIFVMKFLGVGLSDVKHFVVHGIGGGISFLSQFRDILNW